MLFIYTEGFWEDDKRHGKGAFEDLTGYVKQCVTYFLPVILFITFSYKGDWQRGVKHGRGTLTYHSGNVYDGQFQDGLVLSTDFHSFISISSFLITLAAWTRCDDLRGA